MSRIRAAVLGSPIEHSLSPVLHRAAYQELGLDDWSYDRFATCLERATRTLRTTDVNTRTPAPFHEAVLEPYEGDRMRELASRTLHRYA